MAHEYEFISDTDLGYKFSVVDMIYRTPHLHREIELCLLLEGSICVTSRGRTLHFRPGDFWIVNPWQMHDVRIEPGSDRALVPEVQVAPGFFQGTFPQISRTDFDFLPLDPASLGPQTYRSVLDLFLRASTAYYARGERYALRCAGLLCLLFDAVLAAFPHRVLSGGQRREEHDRTEKLRRISDHVEGNFHRKLLLSEIAEREGMSMGYLSHFFRQNFGMPYQEYLKRLRCEKAADLLVGTTLPLMEISEHCGFSDSKYFRGAFAQVYGCSPALFRQNSRRTAARAGEAHSPTRQTFLPDAACLELLQNVSADQLAAVTPAR